MSNSEVLQFDMSIRRSGVRLKVFEHVHQ